MCAGDYAASLADIGGGSAPSASSESSISRWAALDDLERRSIVEYMDMESLGDTDRAMTSKMERSEWMKALRGMERTFLERYMNTWFVSKRLPSMLRWCIKRGVVAVFDFRRYVLFIVLLEKCREYDVAGLENHVESEVIQRAAGARR